MAFADFIRLSSAYSFDGLYEAMNNLRALQDRSRYKYRKPSTRQIIQELQLHPNLFRIEHDQELAALARSQEQVLRDALALGELQAELCQNPDREHGENLINSFCLFEDDLRDIQEALELLAGPKPIKLGFDRKGSEVSVLTNLTALINTPTADIKNLFPTRFDRKGDPIQWPDSTFGGLFPNGDLVEKLKSVVGGKKSLPLKIQRPKI